jgi:hypothetical protein
MSDIFTADVTKTKEDKIKELVSQIYLNNKIAKDALIYAVTFAIGNIWSNPEYTPQEVLDVIGVNGAKLFETSGKIQDTLEDILPDYNRVTIPDNLYTVNPDGSITHNLGETPEA